MTSDGERLVCTADHPYTLVGSQRGAKWAHPGAVKIYDKEDATPCGYVAIFKCPHCGLRFTHRKSW